MVLNLINIFTHNAAKTAKLKFIVNVVLNAEKEVIYAVAGDLKVVHKKGTNFLS